jgi:hypothetical protein
MDPFLEIKIPIPHFKMSFVDNAFVIFLIEFKYSHFIRLSKFLQ